MKKNSIKNTRINAEVQKVLAEILRSGIKDPRVPEFTSVTEVQVAPDLKTCKVWISSFATPEQEKEMLAGLKSAEGYMRSQLAKQLNLRNTPELKFFLDKSIEYGNYMSGLIKEANRGIADDGE